MQNNWYKNINKKIVREWFQLADEDFKYAEDTFRETENYRMICFVCQQVVEKYLKGYLQFKNIYFPKIHNLVALLSLANQAYKNFLDFENNCKILDKYYIETRYPGGALDIFEKQRAQEAINLTQEIIDFIKQKILKS